LGLKDNPSPIEKIADLSKRPFEDFTNKKTLILKLLGFPVNLVFHSKHGVFKGMSGLLKKTD